MRNAFKLHTNNYVSCSVSVQIWFYFLNRIENEVWLISIYSPMPLTLGKVSSIKKWSRFAWRTKISEQNLTQLLFSRRCQVRNLVTKCKIHAKWMLFTRTLFRCGFSLGVEICNRSHYWNLMKSEEFASRCSSAILVYEKKNKALTFNSVSCQLNNFKHPSNLLFFFFQGRCTDVFL